MNFKKKVSGSWTDTPHYIHNTSTDTITTLPADIYANDTTATVGLKGNMEQSSVPSPTSPVTPEGTGERTGNVMPAGEQKTVETNGVTFSSDGKGKYSISGTATASAGARFTLMSAFTTPISVSNGGQGTLSFFNTQSNNDVYFGFYNGTTRVDDWAQNPIGRVSTAYNAVGNKYIDNVVIIVGSGATVDMTITPEFTNDGVLPSEFEPYGYKIPISSASTTTPVYLGEVQTTRKIGKYVFTGEENISDIGDYYNTNVLVLSVAWSVTTSTTGGFQINNGGNRIWAIKSYFSSYATAADFKTYLAQQYAAGMPVTVWYVLATEETAVVNEPLMKIGDYADEVSGITIPAIAGGDSVDVETTVKPSEVSLTYTGWHDAEVKEWDGSEWQ